MLRPIIIGLTVCAALPLSACDKADPFGVHTEPARQVVAPLELTGRVVDAADLLSNDFELVLSGELEQLEKETLAQLVVVTTPNMQGYSIEDYSLMLGRGWEIGDAERNDGLLLVVAPNERKVRIEVGYGLESTVEDPEASEIIRAMTPFLEDRDYPGAIDLGVELLGAELAEVRLKEAA